MSADPFAEMTCEECGREFLSLLSIRSHTSMHTRRARKARGVFLTKRQAIVVKIISECAPHPVTSAELGWVIYPGIDHEVVKPRVQSLVREIRQKFGQDTILTWRLSQRGGFYMTEELSQKINPEAWR